MVRQLSRPARGRIPSARRPSARRRLLLSRPRAFTLVELMVSVGVILLLSSLVIALVTTQPVLQERRVRQAALELQAFLLQARTFALKANASCQVSQTTSSPPIYGPDATFSNNSCTSGNLSTVNLASATGATGLSMQSGSPTSFTFTGNGSLAGSGDAETILSATNSPTSWCVLVTAPGGQVLVGSQQSGETACNYVRD